MSYSDGFFSAAIDLIMQVERVEKGDSPERAMEEWRRIARGLDEHGDEISGYERRKYSALLATQGERMRLALEPR